MNLAISADLNDHHLDNLDREKGEAYLQELQKKLADIVKHGEEMHVNRREEHIAIPEPHQHQTKFRYSSGDSSQGKQ